MGSSAAAGLRGLASPCLVALLANAALVGACIDIHRSGSPAVAPDIDAAPPADGLSADDGAVAPRADTSPGPDGDVGALTPDAGDGAATDAARPHDTLDAVPDAHLDGADAPEATPDTAVDGPKLVIVVEGSTEEIPPDDGHASQTPEPYRYGLQRMLLLRDVDDPAPEVIFDHAPSHVLVDMHDRTTVAEVAIAGLPQGSFPYFRIALTHVDATVETRLHGVPVVGTVKVPMRIVYALSDATVDAIAMDQGDARATANIYGQVVTTPYSWPVTYPLPVPGAWAESIGGTTYVTFMLPEPLEVSAAPTDDLTFAIRYQIRDSFRWIDTDAEEGYADGVWDITVSTPIFAETVVQFGATSFELVPEPPVE